MPHRSTAPSASFYTFDVTGFENGETSGSAAGYSPPSCGSSYADGDAAGSTSSITCSGGSATNYAFDVTDTATLTVTQATLTVTPGNQTLGFGDPAPGASFYTFSVTGFQNLEDASNADSYIPPTCGSGYVPGDPAGTYVGAITCGGGANDGTAGSARDYTGDDAAVADRTGTPGRQHREGLGERGRQVGRVAHVDRHASGDFCHGRRILGRDSFPEAAECDTAVHRAGIEKIEPETLREQLAQQPAPVGQLAEQLVEPRPAVVVRRGRRDLPLAPAQ